MTNLSNSSRTLPRILIIHGLNNSLESFTPLKEAFVKLGFECSLICLPGHGEDRHEVSGLEMANTLFEKVMRPYTDQPYAVIAFSQGALYLQLWLRQTRLPRPNAQILLAPAIAIRYFSVIQGLLGILPSKLIIKSQMPPELRRFSYLYVRDYRHLHESIRTFQKESHPFHVPTKIIIDAKDELVDAQRLKKLYGECVTTLKRPYLKGKFPGKYHVVFHPEYFQEGEWEAHLKQMVEFLKQSTKQT